MTRISNNLKNLELKFLEELENITSKLQTVCPPSVSTSKPDPPLATNSPPTSSVTVSSPHTRYAAHADVISQFVFNNNTHDNEESPIAHDLHRKHDESNHESDFSFTDSFVQPMLSPRIPLN